KPPVPIYEQMGHIPLLIAWPGVDGGAACDALTTSVDINSTVRDVFGVESRHTAHGRSLAPLLDGDASAVREWALAGVWGREGHLVEDDGMKYARAPQDGNEPLSVWSNRWSTMPLVGWPGSAMPLPDDRAQLDRMPGSTVPVIRQPFVAGDMIPFWGLGKFTG